MSRISLLVLLIHGLCFGGTFDVSKAKNQVDFLAVGQPSALKIKGSASQPEKNISGVLKTEGNKVSGTVTLQLSSLDSGIELRDDHMKNKYLEVGTHPTAELTLKDVVIQKDETPFKGELKLHGVTKPVEGKISGNIEKDNVEMKLNFTLLLQDHGISIPSYLGIKVANDVKITASTEGKLLAQGTLP